MTSSAASYGPATASRPRVDSPAIRILLVFDDAQLRAVLSAFLAAHGYDVVSFGGALPFTRRAGDWDAAIIDAAAAQGALRWLRSNEVATRTPTIAIATGRNNAVARPLWDCVDAVLHEPLDAHKLLLVMRGLCAGRRHASERAAHEVTRGPLTLHAQLNMATVAAREIALTEVETRVLRELMLAASSPVSRDRLTRYGLCREWSPDDRCLDGHIKRLRRKLGPDRHCKTPIRTVRSIGYMLLEQWQPAI